MEQARVHADKTNQINTTHTVGAKVGPDWDSYNTPDSILVRDKCITAPWLVSASMP